MKSGKDEEVIEQVVLVPIEEICPFPGQPRTYFNQERLRSLASSIDAAGQVTPGSVIRLPSGSKKKYQLIDGQRRLHALGMTSKTHMKVIISTTIDNEDDQFLVSVLANLHRENHTPLEIARAIKRFRSQGMSWRVIGEIFGGRSNVWAMDHCKILELHPDVLAMLSPTLPEDEQLTFTTAVALTGLPMDLQKGVAWTILNKGLGTLRAKAFIKREARAAGTFVESRAHSPRKNHEKFRNFVKKQLSGIELFEGEPQCFFNDMFLHREVEDCEEMAELLMEAVSRMGGLYKAVLKAQAAKTASDEKDQDDFQAKVDAENVKIMGEAAAGQTMAEAAV